MEANSYSELQTEAHHTVHAERKVQARASDHLGITGSQHLSIGNWIKIDGSGVVFSSAGVKVNGGGRPGSGSGASPLLPRLLRQADADQPGAVQ